MGSRIDLDPNGSASRLDEIAGYALLLDFLEENRDGWLRYFERSMKAPELASDEEFLTWVEAERKRDPGLVARTRKVLSRFREDLMRAGPAHGRGSPE